MQEIWASKKTEYDKIYNMAMETPLSELDEKLKNVQMMFYNYPKSCMNLLPTCGCDHHYNNGKFTGCSMCNYHSHSIRETAIMRAVRNRDEELYARVLKQGFINKRGYVYEHTGEEVITGYNFLSDIEFPQKAYELLFENDPVYKKRPFLFSFETRIDSITTEKLATVRKYLDKGRILVESGIETGNEWIRNHWLNKNTNNNGIEHAIQLCHTNKMRFKGNVIFGIPGFCEKDSINDFIQTILWLDDIGCDYITAMILNQKEYTLQNYLAGLAQRNPEPFEKIGIDINHNMLPWLFSFTYAMHVLLTQRPSLVKKLGIGQYSIELNSVPNELAYNDIRDCNCFYQTIQTIVDFNQTFDQTCFSKLYVQQKENPCNCYNQYEKTLERQKNSNQHTTIEILADAIAHDLNIKNALASPSF